MIKLALKENSLRNLLYLSFCLVVGVPVLIVFIINPQYQKIIVNNAQSDAVQLASHLILSGLQNKIPFETSSFDKTDALLLQEITAHFNLLKIKMFSKTGEIVFSTESSEIGTQNTKEYFYNFVAKGKVVTKVVKKNQMSMEDKLVKIDVVECYVPIMISDNFSGAFEIYMDITSRLIQINKLYYKILLVVLLLVTVFIISMLILLRYSGKNIQMKQIAEKEKEKLITELQAALGKIKILNGMIPICAHCKKIRDDKGYWNRIESYINVGSDSDLSHSICPDCAQKYYKDFNPYED